MRTHRFFITQSEPSHFDLAGSVGKKITLTDETVLHQWRHVLRFKMGQVVHLLDNSGQEFRAVISALTNKIAEVEILERIVEGANSPSSHFGNQVFLYLALAKRDSFEWTIEKGTELGVAGFVPIISEHSEKKVINLDRTKILIKEASEQSGRTTLAEITDPAPLSTVLPNLSGKSFVLDPRGEPLTLSTFKTSADKTEDAQRINIFVGPEGGWSPSEIERFKAGHIPVFSTGHQVMRAETAAVSIAALLLLDY